MKVNLHIHTTASDGNCTPAELVQLALARGISVIAVTDHESTEGVEPALEAARGTSLEVIPGVEISTDLPKGEAHLLGYYMDLHDSALQENLSLLRDSRCQRAKGMVKKLGQLGVQLSWERVIELADGGAMGRPHIAQAMLEAGHVTSLNEAFDYYIGRHCPAYVERYKLSPADAIGMITAARGLPVLAHPLDTLDLVPELVEEGLVGLEAFYTGYGEKEVQTVLQLVEKYGLIATAGSDFHGGLGMPGRELEALEMPPEFLERLRALHSAASFSRSAR